MDKANEIADALQNALENFEPDTYEDREVMRLAGQLVGAVQALGSYKKE